MKQNEAIKKTCSWLSEDLPASLSFPFSLQPFDGELLGMRLEHIQVIGLGLFCHPWRIQGTLCHFRDSGNCGGGGKEILVERSRAQESIVSMTHNWVKDGATS
jgi:hypothetical protein